MAQLAPLSVSSVGLEIHDLTSNVADGDTKEQLQFNDFGPSSIIQDTYRSKPMAYWNQIIGSLMS